MSVHSPSGITACFRSIQTCDSISALLCVAALSHVSWAPFARGGLGTYAGIWEPGLSRAVQSTWSQMAWLHSLLSSSLRSQASSLTSLCCSFLCWKHDTRQHPEQSPFMSIFSSYVWGRYCYSPITAEDTGAQTVSALPLIAHLISGDSGSRPRVLLGTVIHRPLEYSVCSRATLQGKSVSQVTAETCLKPRSSLKKG